jgi:hypothetical protein
VDRPFKSAAQREHAQLRQITAVIQVNNNNNKKKKKKKGRGLSSFGGACGVCVCVCVCVCVAMYIINTPLLSPNPPHR